MALVRAALREPCPEVLEACLPQLEEAARNLAMAAAAAAADPPAATVRSELEALRADLHACARLIEQGMALGHMWAGILAAAAGGYSHTGDPVPLSARSGVSMHG